MLSIFLRQKKPDKRTLAKVNIYKIAKL